MHELSIVRYLVETADAAAHQAGAEQVRFLTVTIGAMTGVIPRYVREYYPEVCIHTLLEGSELRIEEEAALVFCKDCGTTFDPGNTENRCPSCGSGNYEIVAGKTLIIKEMGYI